MLKPVRTQLTRGLAVLGSSLFLLLSSHAFAQTIKEESFTSNLGIFSSTGSVSTGTYGARLRGGSSSSITSSQISLSGFTNISVSYTRSTYGLDLGESFTAAYSVNGGAFTTIESLRTASGSGSFTLPSNVNGQNIALRYSISASSSLEYLSVDNIVISGDTSSGGGGGSTGTLPPVSRIDVNGPFTTTQHKNVGPTGSAWVVHPSTLATDTFLHPILIWGPGAGTGPAEYDFFLDRVASHGFVVFSVTSTGDGSEMTAGLNWLIAENNRAASRYYRKLDVSNIAFGGHSRGSLSTFGVASDNRIKTTLHIAGGSFDGNGPDNLRKPAIYIAGEDDTLATPNMETDYSNTDVPVFFTIIDNTSHTAATRNGMAPIVAWLRWHLAGETTRRADFLNYRCTFCVTPYTSTSKNW